MTIDPKRTDMTDQIPLYTDADVHRYAYFVAGHPDARVGQQHLGATRAILDGLAQEGRLRLATEATDQPTRVPDLPCPKCGDADVVVRYCDGCKQRLYSDPCRHHDAEHFHRRCRRCGYGWQTDDAIDAKVVCQS